MIPASIRAEVLRLRRWPALWVLLGVWFTLNLTFMYLLNYIGYASGDSSDATEGQSREQLLAQMMPAAVPEEFTGGTVVFGGALMLILGAMTTGSGYSWDTWKTVLTQRASRGAALAGAMLGVLAVVVGVVLGAFALDLGVATVIAWAESQPIVLPPIGRALAGIGSGIVILAMWAMLGILLGIVVRGPAPAVGLGLVWILVLENVLRFFGELLGGAGVMTNYLPGTAAGSLAGALRTLPGEATPGVLTTISGAQSLLTLSAYLIICVAAAIWLLRRRDLV
ncbi:ABC transporter permease subunit [Nocardia sp. NPDC048505]|uniref:ABC transporter permease subunit n=1 Tax=unclassified Nocardia TaxID=2637762 RepID=UPI00340BB79A